MASFQNMRNSEWRKDIAGEENFRKEPPGRQIHTTSLNPAAKHVILESPIANLLTTRAYCRLVEFIKK